MNTRLSLILCAGVLIVLAVPVARGQTRATVVATSPPNGATDVSPMLASFSITFSKPMDTSLCGASTRNWPYPPSGQGGGSCAWSADKLTMTLTRYNPETPFPPGLKIEAYLVDPEWKESYLLDAQGNHIDPYYFSFTIADDMPRVLSTNPPNGATEVPAYLDTVTVTFSKPMDTSICGAETNWPYKNGGACTWSADKLTMILKRYTAIPVPSFVFYLNLPDTGPFLRDTDGFYLGPCSFSFTTTTKSQPPVTKVTANPQKGFQWPYYLYVPLAIKNPAVLLVEPNNSGQPQKDPSLDDKLASEIVDFHKYWAYDLGSPYLVPAFPRPLAHTDVYTQSLDRDTLLTNLPGLARIDLQLIAMIDDARARLSASGINVGSKVWMVGFSASGDFASHFALLHPDRIQAVSAGGGDFATVPLSVWKGKTLPFPTGIADLAQLVGTPFDAAAFSRVPVQIYVGDRNRTNFSIDEPGPDTDIAHATLVKEVFGGPYVNRFPAVEAAYNSIGSDCQFIVFPGMKHVWPDWGYIREFLEHNRTEPFPPALPKPFLYTLYFPHVASFGPWETEIALTNTVEVPVKGELQAVAADGGEPLESIPFTIPAGGRMEYTAGSAFKKPQDIAYVKVRSDSGFLAGYTRFSQPGNRVSLPLVGGTTEGYFTKVERGGWTGIAFVNVDTGTANISLQAYNDNGTLVDTRTVQLTPGRKYVAMVDQLFAGADLSRLRYFRFSSDQKLAGFTVSASSDGQMLDGLQALGGYIQQR